MKKHVLACIALTFSITTSAFTRCVEISADNRKYSCLIDYNSKDKGSIVNGYKVPVNVTLENKTDYSKIFDQKKLLQGLKLVPREHANVFQNFAIRYLLPILAGAGYGLEAIGARALAKKLQLRGNNLGTWQEEFSLKNFWTKENFKSPNLAGAFVVTSAMLTPVVYFAIRYYLNLENKRTVLGKHDNDYYWNNNQTNFRAYASKKELDKKRLKLAI